VINLFFNKKIIFWDFDGVIKDSVQVKTDAFRSLFLNVDQKIRDKIVNHHLDNGGMSRLDKIPIYLEWVGLDQSKQNIERYINLFAKQVEKGVVESQWVPGVLETLEMFDGIKKHNILVTATPHDEILRIVNQLFIDRKFSEIFGAPSLKSEAMLFSLSLYEVETKEAIMIGDSKADYLASKECGIEFLLRRTSENFNSFKNYKGPSIFDFKDVQ
jgi:HAD superfamily hydrolase (TIGR01549 family)